MQKLEIKDKNYLCHYADIEKLLFEHQNDLESLGFLNDLINVYKQKKLKDFNIKNLWDFYIETWRDKYLIHRIHFLMMVLFFIQYYILDVGSLINFVNIVFLLWVVFLTLNIMYIIHSYLVERPYIFTYTKTAIKQLNRFQFLYDYMHIELSFKTKDFIQFLQDSDNITILQRLFSLPTDADVKKLITLNFDQHYCNRWKLKQNKQKRIEMRNKEIQNEISKMEANIKNLQFLLTNEFENHDIWTQKLELVKNSGDLELIQTTNKNLESLMIAASRQDLSSHQILSGI